MHIHENYIDVVQLLKKDKIKFLEKFQVITIIYKIQKTSEKFKRHFFLYTFFRWLGLAFVCSLLSTIRGNSCWFYPNS